MERSKLKQEALRLYADGFNIVAVKGKEALGKWKRFQNESQSAKAVDSLRWEDATGIGVILGFNRIFAVDIDAVSDQTVLSDWLQALSLPEDYPWVEITGADNYQIFFRCEEPLRRVVAEPKVPKCAQVELRGVGNYSLVPPSLHPTTQNEYRWRGNSPERKDLVWLTAEQLHSAFAALTASRGRARMTPRSKLESSRSPVTTIEKGHRNSSLFKKSCDLRSRGVPAGEALEMITSTNEVLCDPPLGQSEVQRTVESAYSYVDDDLSRRAEDSGHAETIFDASELLSRPAPVRKFLVKDLIPEVGVVMLAGVPGAGKSILAANLAVSISTGVPFLGREVERESVVLYVDNENGLEDHHYRLTKMAPELPANAIRFMFGPPEDQRLIEAIERECQKARYGVVVLDSLYLSHTGKENEEFSIKKILKPLKELSARQGLAMVVIHHTKKGVQYDGLNMDQISGSSAFNRIVRVSAMMIRSEKDQSKRIFRVVKMSNGPDLLLQDTHLLSLDPETLWFRSEGVVDEKEHLAQRFDARGASVKIEGILKIMNRQRMTASELVGACEQIGISRPTVYRYLADAEKRGALQKEQGGYSFPGGI